MSSDEKIQFRICPKCKEKKLYADSFHKQEICENCGYSKTFSKEQLEVAKEILEEWRRGEKLYTYF